MAYSSSSSSKKYLPGRINYQSYNNNSIKIYLFKRVMKLKETISQSKSKTSKIKRRQKKKKKRDSSNNKILLFKLQRVVFFFFQFYIMHKLTKTKRIYFQNCIICLQIFFFFRFVFVAFENTMYQYSFSKFIYFYDFMK